MTLVNTHRPLVLIVEDDPDTRDVEAIVLEEDGFAVLTAKNGEEGLRLARERCPAVILLDIALPMASGFEVLKALKRAPVTVHIPVVLISAYANLVEDCAASGASACVQKPFNIDDLVSDVRRALRSVADQPVLTMVGHA